MYRYKNNVQHCYGNKSPSYFLSKIDQWQYIGWAERQRKAAVTLAKHVSKGLKCF